MSHYHSYSTRQYRMEVPSNIASSIERKREAKPPPAGPRLTFERKPRQLLQPPIHVASLGSPVASLGVPVVQTFIPAEPISPLVDPYMGHTVVSGLYPFLLDKVSSVSPALVAIVTVLIKSDVSVGRGDFSFPSGSMWIHDSNVIRAKWSLLNGTYPDRIRLGASHVKYPVAGKLFDVHQPNIIVIPRKQAYMIKLCRDTLDMNTSDAAYHAVIEEESPNAVRSYDKGCEFLRNIGFCPPINHESATAACLVLDYLTR